MKLSKLFLLFITTLNIFTSTYCVRFTINRIKSKAKSKTKDINTAAKEVLPDYDLTKLMIFQAITITNNYNEKEHQSLVLCANLKDVRTKYKYFIIESDPDTNIQLLSFVTETTNCTFNNRGWEISKRAVRFYDAKDYAIDLKQIEAAEIYAVEKKAVPKETKLGEGKTDIVAAKIAINVGKAVSKSLAKELGWWFGHALFIVGDVFSFGALTPLHVAYTAAHIASTTKDAVDLAKDVSDSLSSSDSSSLKMVNLGPQLSAKQLDGGWSISSIMTKIDCFKKGDVKNKKLYEEVSNYLYSNDITHNYIFNKCSNI